ncbi:MAG TPA: 2-phospho-L-lactate transferase [Acidimicrobiales bacterium]|nr:2-phospho-L-lactate transferase [Acidimicrobiales bacterium]
MLAGGVGAARFLAGLVEVVAPSSVVAVVNTGDDTRLHGLHISPDLDTVTYTLAGEHNAELGWGLAGETWTVMAALERLGAPTWFRLGDRDLATHLYRTGRLAEGAPLSTVTAEIARAFGVEVRLLPMSDDPVRTRLELADGPEVEFQEYFVRLRHAVAVRSVRFAGAEEARPAPGVLEALEEADAVVIAPSNPVVSIGPILALEPVSAVLARRRACVVAISPIVAGAALKGPAARLLAELTGDSSAEAVARRYSAVAGAFVLDERDAALAGRVGALGLRPVVAETVMGAPGVAAGLARAALDAVGVATSR